MGHSLVAPPTTAIPQLQEAVPADPIRQLTATTRETLQQASTTEVSQELANIAPPPMPAVLDPLNIAVQAPVPEIPKKLPTSLIVLVRNWRLKRLSDYVSLNKPAPSFCFVYRVSLLGFHGYSRCSRVHHVYEPIIQHDHVYSVHVVVGGRRLNVCQTVPLHACSYHAQPPHGVSWGAKISRG